MSYKNEQNYNFYTSQGINTMNTPKLSILLFSSVFILSACSTAPTSQNIGKNIGTAMILGGLAYGSKDKDSEDSDSSSKGKDGGAIALAGLAVHFLIARSEKIAQGKVDHKRAVEKRKKENIKNEKLKKASKYYKDYFKPNETHLLMKYLAGKKHTFKPHYYSRSGEKISGSNTPYIKVELESPYKSTLTSREMNGSSCKISKKTEDADPNAIAQQVMSWFSYKTKLTINTVTCKNVPQSFIIKEARRLNKMGIKNNSKIISLAKSKSFNFSFTGGSDIEKIVYTQAQIEERNRINRHYAELEKNKPSKSKTSSSRKQQKQARPTKSKKNGKIFWWSKKCSLSRIEIQ